MLHPPGGSPLSSPQSSLPGMAQNKVGTCYRGSPPARVESAGVPSRIPGPKYKLVRCLGSQPCWVEKAVLFRTSQRVIEQADVCQDGAQAIVSMRQIVLQEQSALEIGNRLQMLEVLRWSPEQKSP